MHKWFKKYFVPHHGNDHKPHFLRSENIRAIAIFVIMIEVIAIVVPMLSFIRLDTSKFMASVLPSVVASLTNQERDGQSLPELKDNPILDAAAQLKADDMIANQYFAHVSPTGVTPWFWFKKAGYNYSYAGENLAVDFNDSKDVTDAWMKSPTHRANIVKAAYTEFGTGIASGQFEGKDTTFVVQLYATPKIAVIAVANVIPAPVPTASTKIITTAPEVLGTETSFVDSEADPASHSLNPVVSFLNRIASSPRHAMNLLLLILFALALIAILLKVFIRMDIQHPKLITNGLALIALVIGIYTANIYIGKASVPILPNGIAQTQEL